MLIAKISLQKVMAGAFNNPFQKVREGAKDVFENKDDSQTSTNPSSGSALFYHLPPSAPTPIDPYSHTAKSTAGFGQTSAYPTLASYNRPQPVQTFPARNESTTKNSLEQDRIDVTTNKRNARESIQHGAVIQLLSKSSGRSLQVVMTANGTLAFDGNGVNNSFNAYFTVEEGEKGRFRFHNNCNYLAFDGKQPCILTLPPGPKNNPSVDFRIQDVSGNSDLIALESCTCKNHFISISSDGFLKTKNLKEKNLDTQFSVQPITMNQQPTYPYYAQPFHMHPQGMVPGNVTSPFMPSQPPVYHQPVQLPTPNSSTPSSTSSGLYPQFN